MDNSNGPKYNPNGFLYFIFALAVLMQWFIFMGFFKGEVNLMYGLLSLMSFPVYLIGSKMLADSGDHFGSNTFYMFGTLFGGIFGANGVLTWADAKFQLGVDPTFMGIPMIIAAVVLIPVTLTVVYLPLMQCITWLLVPIWFFIGGLSYYVNSYTLFMVNVWMTLIVGLLILYIAASELSKSMGLNGLPMGKPVKRMPYELPVVDLPEGVADVE